MILSHPTFYIVNSNAVGDISAALPVLKHLIETYHKDGKYKVGGMEQFRELFFFVPDENFCKIEDGLKLDEPHVCLKLNMHNEDRSVVIAIPNMAPVMVSVVKQCLLPLRMHLQQYASLQFSNRILPELDYLPFPVHDAAPSRCVAVTTIYRSSVRTMLPEELAKVCSYIKERGYTPLFLGKDDCAGYEAGKEAHNLDFDFSVGIDMRNKTTITQAINIMAGCKAVVGVDNGLLHLAGMTDVPIVAGYTMVAPELRMPIRHGKLGWNVYPVVPDVPCAFCQNKWQVDNHDFNDCKLKTYACVNGMRAELFIEQLKLVFDR